VTIKYEKLSPEIATKNKKIGISSKIGIFSYLQLFQDDLVNIKIKHDSKKVIDLKKNNNIHHCSKMLAFQKYF